MEGEENKPMENEQGTIQQNGKYCLDIFAYEMWREILSRLEGKTSNESLLNCRAVCLDLEPVAEEMLLRSAAEQYRKRQEIMEDPLEKEKDFVNPGRNFERFITKQCGTRLRTAEDVELFLAQMEGQTRAPFPNGYVIYSPSSQLSLDDAQRFHTAFESLVNAFSDLITSLLYNSAHLSSIDFFVQLSIIFRLKNLKNLFICSRLPYFNYQNETLTVPENIEFSFAPAITQLQFYGISNSISKQITRIFNHLQPNTITHLGLDVMRPELWEHFCVSTEHHNAPRLTELSIQIFNETVRIANVPKKVPEEAVAPLLRILDTQQSETLEIMNWDAEFYLCNHHLSKELPLNSEVKYPRLKHFKLNYHILKRWRSLITQLKEKFPILEIFTVTAGRHYDGDLSGRTVSRRGIYDVVSTLWEIFPADTSNLREVRVPCYDWILKRDGPLPLGVLPNIE